MPDSKICEPGWAVPIFHSPSGERKEHHQSETRTVPTCADNIKTLYLLLKSKKEKGSLPRTTEKLIPHPSTVYKQLQMSLLQPALALNFSTL